ncbi:MULTISPECIES: EAL domain-containing protein [unclassified Shewanella]|uniref:EAL domain-containing protein n=1 Tax=Shewanella TaxID=22 RepID=UPI0021D9ABD8|nr:MULTISPECIES: EAL domain-containing protein [unclassified Shewanella]
MRSTWRQRIESLRQLGILMAIDNFGTGQTTLSLLQTMPLDYLKIGKTLLKNS